MLDDFFSQRPFLQEPIPSVDSKPFEGAFSSENGVLEVAMPEEELQNFVRHAFGHSLSLHAPRDFTWPLPLVGGRKVLGVSEIRSYEKPNNFSYSFDARNKTLSYMGLIVPYKRSFRARLQSVGRRLSNYF